MSIQDKTSELAKNGGWSKEPGVAKAAQDMIDFVKAGYLADGAPDEYPASQNKMGLDQNVTRIRESRPLYNSSVSEGVSAVSYQGRSPYFLTLLK